MSSVEFTGFIDGINTSLESEVDLDDLTEESELNMKIDFEKLYYNMLNVKADWLYNLPQWDGILSEEKRKDIKKQFNTERIAVSNKIGRNDPCTCGSGKKFKKCCGA
jgi:preprotein translocase subunit SecA